MGETMLGTVFSSTKMVRRLTIAGAIATTTTLAPAHGLAMPAGATGGGAAHSTQTTTGVQLPGRQYYDSKAHLYGTTKQPGGSSAAPEPISQLPREALSVAQLAQKPVNASTSKAAAVAQATSGLQWLDKEFLDSHKLLYRTTDSAHEPWAAIWPTSQVLMGAIDVANLTHKPADLARVQRIIDQLKYYKAPGGMYMARAIRSLRYTDDNNWIGLDLLDAYSLLHNKQYLTDAEDIFTYLVSEWDPKKGGIKWADGVGSHEDHPTVSTAPASTLGFRLAALTHKAYYRTWATRFFNWENAHLRAPNGLYWDNLRVNGTINKDFVAYNQGVMIDADLAYAKLTGNQKYVATARKLAATATKAMPNPSKARGDLAAYDAIFFQSLMHLNAVSKGAASLAPVQAFAKAERATALAPRAAAARGEQGLLEQAAYVIAASVLAS